MDFEETQNRETLYGPLTGNDPAKAKGLAANQRPPKKRSGWKIFWRILFVLSILANVFLLLMVLAVSTLFMTGQRGLFIENVLREGSSLNKVAVIRLEGIIDGRVSEAIRKQLRTAQKDKSIKALIIRTITPGGGVAASDRIHHQILKFRKESGKPVVAFMQTVAASGGYYTSVACDKIISEPTAITGSIGVMTNHFVLKQLLEEKLGIAPVVVKSGEKKDWPSIFTETTEEQKQYLRDKLIMPAYDRFVMLVTDGRKMLTEAQVRQLSDGSIYNAAEALEKQLIDQIGYFDEAIALAETLADIENAEVIEYAQPFSLSSILTSQSRSLWNIERNLLERLSIPQLFYLWDENW